MHSLPVFLRLTGLLIPSFVVVILPITTYVVIQFVYHRLAGDRELTVMRSAGLSPFALARPALCVAALSVAIGYWLSLWAVPATLAQFRSFQWEIRNKMVAFLLQEGVFTSVSDKLTVYVRARDAGGGLRDQDGTEQQGRGGSEQMKAGKGGLHGRDETAAGAFLFPKWWQVACGEDDPNK